MSTENDLDHYTQTMMPSWGRPLAAFERGEGSRVWDVDGVEYLDFLGGIAVNVLGHAHPVFVDAVSRQAATLAHVSNYFTTPPQLALVDRLLRLSGGDRVFLANSGTEANEAALKLAKLTGRPRILALEKAFHGRSTGALALTGKPALREPFEPLLGGIEHLELSIEALEAAIGDDVAALIVEPIQGEAGVIPLPEGYLRAARELTQKHGALLIVDEIQTGAGRTGAWFAFQHEGIEPDAMTLAKGIGGGFPIGALVTFHGAGDLFRPGQHGTTFGGNALASAVADAVLGEVENAGLVENAAARGAELAQRVLALGSPLVTGVRGRGLLLGIELAAPVANEIRAAAHRHGLIVNAPADDVVRLAPALNIGDEELAVFLERFGAALAEVAATAPAPAADATHAATGTTASTPTPTGAPA
ncbi:acetylornithine transaminase [Schumannella sp. 10F1B-5-1]|uniref:acetylornithine transaminase n=1 Tax=Schumannella sp. 10F1B-5-1 TaxID=2590780 RepID=UPI0011307C72|nr:acetylornithine transaminase [Schumannella sp. 10F1B-5-1]TPW70288.1 acetylornithine transaminase [Schumannella sp. 10F1B-5-1]